MNEKLKWEYQRSLLILSIYYLEALFLGQTNLLDEDVQEAYVVDLKKRYQFIKQKFQLDNLGVLPIQFFRLRPANFPTIRLSQFAMLYFKEQNLFSKIIEIENIEDYYALFGIETSNFWKTHYTFSKTAKSTKKKLTHAYIDLLLINTIIPIKFSYAKYLGNNDEDSVLDLIKSIRIERNSVVDKFLSLKDLDKSAMTSQGLIQLKTEYCNKNKCLQCAVGNSLVEKNR
mgnify:FL=1